MFLFLLTELHSQSDHEDQRLGGSVQKKRPRNEYYEIVLLPSFYLFKNLSSGLFEKVTQPMLVKVKNKYIIGRIVENHLRPLFVSFMGEQMVKIDKGNYTKMLPLSPKEIERYNMNGLMQDNKVL